MKTSYLIAWTALALGLGMTATSCQDETFPSDDYMTSDQVEAQPDAMKGFVNAITGRLGQSGTFSDSYTWDIGYPSFIIMREVQGEDYTAYTTSYDYFYYWNANMYLGEYVTAQYPWKYFYGCVTTTNNVLRLTPTDDTLPYFGIAHFYRALFYFEIARMYEYHPTGISSIDSEAEANGIVGLTAPIITETTTEDEARNCPRATFYDMYRYILDDLDKAEEYLEGYSRATKREPNLAVVYGQKARVYLDMGSRFENYPEMLTTVASSGVDLGVNSAQEAYAKAADYADKAILYSGATPLTESEWHSGFNSMSVSSWMLAFGINKELLDENSWKNFISYVSSETNFGVAGIDLTSGRYSNAYSTQRVISKALYDKISTADWRRRSWVDPADAGQESAISKYTTSVTSGHFAQIPPYANLKFKPTSGDYTNYDVGAAIDLPLMRVEEMWFIKAEALAASQGVAAGKAVLESLINGYRYSGYTCDAGSLSEFRKEMMLQKRIEFWGEGILCWDYQRLRLSITRGYEGTNYPTADYMLNTKEGYCAPWWCTFILKSELGLNSALIANPDPSLCDDELLWTGSFSE